MARTLAVDSKNTAVIQNSGRGPRTSVVSGQTFKQVLLYACSIRSRPQSILAVPNSNTVLDPGHHNALASAIAKWYPIHIPS